MKKLFTGIVELGMLHFCNAQTKEKSEVKFTPPLMVKDNPASSTTEAVKFTVTIQNLSLIIAYG